MKYRKKPVVIEAVQYKGDLDSIKEVIDFIGYIPQIIEGCETHHKFLKIKTLEGEHIASEGDFIIKGVNGEFYPCKPDIFEKTYERV
ncbi:TPA: hypothetical protein JRS25_003692 [Escherichia coli]|nr:hypothetical protein [Escherichia coli]HAY3976970.1 hypothetical protein [Escherichia coli]HBB9210941.1 hypothetical protein [Escherichia coli]